MISFFVETEAGGTSEWHGPGLIGVLVFFAGVVLLVKGRYPRSATSSSSGWTDGVARVVAYAALMRDEYRRSASGASRTRPVARSPGAQSCHKAARWPYRRHPPVDRGRSSGSGTPFAAWRPRPGRPGPVGSWRCGSNYSAGREVGEDRRRRRRLGRGGCGVCSTTGLAARTPCSDSPRRSQPRRSGRRSPSSAASCAAVRTPGAPTPTPPLGIVGGGCRTCPVTVDHAMAAGVAGRLYVVGGYGPGSEPRNTAFAFHHGHWTPLQSMPAPRAAGGAAIVGGKLYVVGGVEAPGRLARDAFAFDFETARWTTFRGPRPREHLGAAALGGRVYVVAGGPAGSTRTRTSSRRSTRGRTVAGDSRGAGEARRHRCGGRRWPAALGRSEEPGGTIRTVYAYSPSTRRWTQLPNMRTSRHGLGLVGGAAARTRSRAARSPG